MKKKQILLAVCAISGLAISAEVKKAEQPCPEKQATTVAYVAGLISGFGSGLLYGAYKYNDYKDTLKVSAEAADELIKGFAGEVLKKAVVEEGDHKKFMELAVAKMQEALNAASATDYTKFMPHELTPSNWAHVIGGGAAVFVVVGACGMAIARYGFGAEREVIPVVPAVTVNNDTEAKTSSWAFWRNSSPAKPVVADAAKPQQTPATEVLADAQKPVDATKPTPEETKKSGQ